MKISARILLLLVVFLFSSLINLSFAEDEANKPIKFELEIKPNQQKVEAKIDGDEHKQIQIRAEYVKLNTMTNNYHIKVTITNNSGMPLLHQLALIDKVEHAEIKYPDSTTDYVKIDDGKQITKILPYYNYGNIKPMQATPREWYISNTGKDEIEVEGYIISKEIPIILDPKIAAANPGVAQTLITYITALRDNDLDGVLAVVKKQDKYFGQDIVSDYKDSYTKRPGLFPATAIFYTHPKSVRVVRNFCYIDYDWTDPRTGLIYLASLELLYDGTNWWITL